MKSNCIAVYLNSCVSTQLYICIAEQFRVLPRKRGSERKSGAPDFFRSPCGAEPIRVYLRYTLPPLDTIGYVFGIPGGILILKKREVI
jgi:hypothetical protein